MDFYKTYLVVGGMPRAVSEYCVNVTEGNFPLKAYEQPDVFKVYMVDTGLLCSKLDITANMVLHTPHSFFGFKGALAENHINSCVG